MSGRKYTSKVLNVMEDLSFLNPLAFLLKKLISHHKNTCLVSKTGVGTLNNTYYLNNFEIFIWESGESGDVYM